MPDISWWEWPLLYCIGGGLTVFLTELYDPPSKEDRDEGMHGFIFIFWPLVIIVYAGVFFVNIPKGIAWTARWFNDQLEEEDDNTHVLKHPDDQQPPRL